VKLPALLMGLPSRVYGTPLQLAWQRQACSFFVMINQGFSRGIAEKDPHGPDRSPAFRITLTVRLSFESLHVVVMCWVVVAGTTSQYGTAFSLL
jgi:hypothetical protein